MLFPIACGVLLLQLCHLASGSEGWLHPRAVDMTGTYSFTYMILFVILQTGSSSWVGSAHGFVMGWKCGWLRHGLEVSFPSSLEGFLTALAGLVLRTETEV